MLNVLKNCKFYFFILIWLKFNYFFNFILMIMKLFWKVVWSHSFLSENLSYGFKAFPRSWNVFFSSIFFPIFIHLLRVSMVKICFFGLEKKSKHVYNDCKPPCGYFSSENDKIGKFRKMLLSHPVFQFWF